MSEHEFTVEREFAAPQDAVWRAWTDPSALAQWWDPHTASVQADVRVGGAFTVTADGRSVSGSYRSVEPPSLLQFAWGDPASTASLVLVALGADTTLLTLTVRPASPDPRSRAAWTSALDRLAADLTPPTTR